MAKMLLLDVQKQKVREVEASNLDEYYKLLNCDTIDIVTREVFNFRRQEKRAFDIICDDNGLLKSDIIPSGIGKDGSVQLVGNLLICNFDKNGNEKSLTEDDVDFIEDSIERVILNEFILKVLMLWM